MQASSKIYRDQVMQEIDALPEEYWPFLLQMIRAFRESVTLKSAEDSFRQGWNEAQSGLTFPIGSLWDGIDVR